MILGSLSSPFLAAYIHSYLYAYTMPRKIVACAEYHNPMLWARNIIACSLYMGPIYAPQASKLRAIILLYAVNNAP